MTESAAKSALRALRDCKVVRASFDHPGFSSLRQLDLATCTAAGAEWDYRLTPRGVQQAEETFG